MRVAYVCADRGVPVFGHKGSSNHVQEVVRSMLGRGARVEGSIDVAVLRVEGEIDGEVRVLKKMVVGPGAQIRGTIATAALEVSDGASIEGPVRMTRPDPS